MSKELYHRFTQQYLPGQREIKDNTAFSDLINTQLSAFCKEKNVKNYRIINCETQELSSSPFSTSEKYVILVVHIAYSAD